MRDRIVTENDLCDIAPCKESLAVKIATDPKLLSFLNYYCLFEPMEVIEAEDTDSYRRKQDLADSIEKIISIPLNSTDLVLFHNLNNEIYQRARQIYRYDVPHCSEVNEMIDLLPVSKQHMLQCASAATKA